MKNHSWLCQTVEGEGKCNCEGIEQKEEQYKILLEKAPPHDSPEFLLYLRDHNEVVEIIEGWLIIKNFKHHTEESPWYTAFLIDDSPHVDIPWASLMEWIPEGWCVMEKPKEVRTVQRLHLHIFPHQWKQVTAQVEDSPSIPSAWDATPSEIPSEWENEVHTKFEIANRISQKCELFLPYFERGVSEESPILGWIFNCEVTLPRDIITNKKI